MVSLKQKLYKFFYRSVIEKSCSSNMLFKDYFIDYLKSQDGSTKSRSFSGSISAAIHIVKGLGNYRMDQIDKNVLRKFINGFAKQTYVKGKGDHRRIEFYSQSMIHKVYILLRSAIKEAAGEDGGHLISMDYMANIKEPRSKKPVTLEPKSLTDSEIKMLIKLISKKRMILVWICILLYTGVRPSEALALKFTDIDYDKKIIHIVRTLSQEESFDVDSLSRKKPRKPIITDLKNVQDGNKVNYQRRALRAGDMLLLILKSWEIYVKGNKKLMEMKRKEGTEEYLFCGSHGQLWLYDDYKQVYDRLLEKHGLNASEYNPYRYRHNCCTRLLRMGVDIKTVQLILGDNSSSMVMRVYANLDKSDVLKGSGDYSENMDLILGIAQREIS
jgi:integrase